MGRWIGLGTATGAVVAVLLQSTVGVAGVVVDIGDAVGEAVVLDAGQWRAYRMTLSFLETLTISVEVIQGGPIDVYATNDGGFGQYADPNATTFGYYADGSRINTTSFPGSFTPPTGGGYYLIVDNAAITEGGATPIGPVTVHVALEKASLVPTMAGLLIAIGAAGAGVVWFLRSTRRKRATARRPLAKAPPPPPS